MPTIQSYIWMLYSMSLPFEVPNSPIPINVCLERSLNKEMAHAFNTIPALQTKSVTCVTSLGQPTSNG